MNGLLRATERVKLVVVDKICTCKKATRIKYAVKVGASNFASIRVAPRFIRPVNKAFTGFFYKVPSKKLSNFVAQLLLNFKV